MREFFDEERNLAVLDRIRQHGVVWNRVETRGPAHQTLAGKTFVLTGSLPTLTRSDAASAIRNAGGKVTSSVTKKTNFLLAGENPGSKLEVARDLGVEIISEARLVELLGAEN